MEADTLKRLDRLVAILIHLQSRRVVRAQELADRFEVSLRTIYRDVRTLENSGVPIVSEAGVGYSIMEGYRLPPVMFTREEAGSFVAAEKLMQKFTDKSLGAHFESAMLKLKAVLRGSDRDWVETLESHVLINPAQALFNENVPNALEILLESIAIKNQVALNYDSLNASEFTQRNIEPVGLFHENNYWYVMGYCHLREGYRQFRTDRIQNIRRTSLAFSKVHQPLEYYRGQREPSEKTRVRLLVDHSVAKYLVNSRLQYGFLSEKRRKDGVEMTFDTPWMVGGFARWFLMFADHATILEPESLKEHVSQLLQRHKERLNALI